jgi:hypothetical protein
MSLDKIVPGIKTHEPITVHEKYLFGTDYISPVSHIATSFGVNLAVTTKDGYLVITQRGLHGVANYRNTYSVPVCESVNPHIDRDENGLVDLFRTAKRGAKEEMGIDVVSEEVKFFSLEVDVNWYLYGLSGLIVSTRYTRNDLISLRSTGIKDKWETQKLYFVKFSPQKVALFIKEKGGISKFNPASFVSIIQSLVYEFGYKSVERAFSQFF